MYYVVSHGGHISWIVEYRRWKPSWTYSLLTAHDLHSTAPEFHTEVRGQTSLTINWVLFPLLTKLYSSVLKCNLPVSLLKDELCPVWWQPKSPILKIPARERSCLRSSSSGCIYFPQVHFMMVLVVLISHLSTSFKITLWNSWKIIVGRVRNKRALWCFQGSGSWVSLIFLSVRKLNGNWLDLMDDGKGRRIPLIFWICDSMSFRTHHKPG